MSLPAECEGESGRERERERETFVNYKKGGMCCHLVVEYSSCTEVSKGL